MLKCKVCKRKLKTWLLLLSLLIVQPILLAENAFNSSFFTKNEWPKTDFKKFNITFSEILSGGPPKDGIPAIDNPVFVNLVNAQDWLDPFEPVVSIEIQGIAKAYPLQILMFHEIVNDTLNNQPIAVTFCPLCNTSIVFLRKVKGQLLDFGTTGRLRNSDLIMYDRQTESWWQQFTGEGLIGLYTDTILTELPSQIISFSVFQQQYPNGMVLSQNTGYKRQYGRNPYRGYDHIDNTPFLMQGPVDKRLPPMMRVLSVTIDEDQKLYPFSTIRDIDLLQDNLKHSPIVIVKTGNIFSALDKNNINESTKVSSYAVFSSILNDRQIMFHSKNNRIYDQETQSEWNIFGQAIKGKLKGLQLQKLRHGIHFAFAWLAFNPNVEIYQPTTKE